MDTLRTKAELRNSFRILRNAFAKNSSLSSSIVQNLLIVVGSEQCTWGSYLPQGSEADPTFEAAHITWAYPQVKDETLDFVVPQSKNWHVNQFKIREPKEGKKIESSQLNGILIPGVAFDRKGNRLGSGKGFFDKTLQGYKGKKVGVAYSVQISNSELPVDKHDVKMDIIVTEKEIIQVGERKVS